MVSLLTKVDSVTLVSWGKFNILTVVTRVRVLLGRVAGRLARLVVTAYKYLCKYNYTYTLVCT